MKRLKSLLSSFLAVVLMVSCIGPLNVSAATTFKDVRGHWAEKYIYAGVSHGYIDGYEDGTFLPDKPISRAEFSKMVNNALGISIASSVGFTDVKSGDWYYAEVRKAVAAGYITGYEDNTFLANKQISRQEAAVIISRIATPPSSLSNVTSLTDSGDIADWAMTGAKFAFTKGYMTGDERQRFSPTGNLTRGEAVKIIESILDSEDIVHETQSTSANNQTYSDRLYVGDFTIASGSNNNSITFENTRILGTLQVGGGNGITLNNAGVNNLAVNNSAADVSVVAKGVSSVHLATVSYGSELQENSITGDGFKNVTLSGSGLRNKGVDLSGGFNVVTVASPAKLNLKSGSINELVVATGGAGSTIDIANRTTVSKLVVNGACDFTGTGVISNAALNVTGSTFEKEPENYDSGGFLVPTMSPKNGANDVSVTSKITLTFDEAVFNSSGNNLTSSYLSNNVIELRKNSASGTKVSFSASIGSNNRVITITPDNDLDKNVKYYVIINSELTNSAGAKNTKQTFTFSTGGGLTPEVNPVDGSDTIPVTTKITMEFDIALSRPGGGTAINASYLQSDVIELRRNSATGTEIDFTASISSDRKTITITPRNDLVTSSTYYVILKKNTLADNSGETNDEQRFSFKTAGTDYLVPTMNPPTGSTGVKVNSKITLTFDEALYDEDGNSITSRYLDDEVFTLRRGSSTGSVVDFSASINSARKVITITPDSNLSSNTKYYLIINAGSLRDGTNSRSNSNDKMTLTFSTASTSSSRGTMDPEVIPANRASDISIDTKITITFDEAVYQTSSSSTDTKPTATYLQNTVVELRKAKSDGSTVDFSATIDSAGKVITITPKSKLDEDTRYYVIVNSNTLRNSSGDKNSKISYYFNTGDTDGILKPTISPANGTYGISANTDIVLKFGDTLYNKDGERLDNKTASQTYVKNSVIQLRADRESGTAVKFSVDISSGKTITITPDSALTEGKTYYVIVTANSLQNSNNSKNSKHVFSFTVGSGLEMTITPDSTTTNFPRNGSIVLKFSDTVLNSTAGELTASYVKQYVSLTQGSSTTKLDVNVSFSNSSKTITITPVDPLLSNTNYTFKLEANRFQTKAGKTNAAANITFKTANTVLIPTVSPSDGSSGIATSTKVTLSFSETLYNSSGVALNTSNIGTAIQLREGTASGNLVEHTIEVTGSKVITITPKSSLKANTNYYVVLLAGSLKNGSGASASTNTKQTFQFKTVDGSSLSNPTVTYSGLNSANKETVTIVFDKAITRADGSAISASYIESNFRLTSGSSGGSPVSFSAAITNSNRTVTLTPTAISESGTATKYEIFAPGTSYYLTIPADTIANSDGKNKAISANFTTDAANASVSVSKITSSTAQVKVDYTYPGLFTIYLEADGKREAVGTSFRPTSATGSFTESLADLKDGVTYKVIVAYKPVGGTEKEAFKSFTTTPLSKEVGLDSVVVIRGDREYPIYFKSGKNQSADVIANASRQVTIAANAEDGTNARITIKVDPASDYGGSASGSNLQSGKSLNVTFAEGSEKLELLITVSNNGTTADYTLTLIREVPDSETE